MLSVGMLRRVRLRAISGPKFSKIFRGRKILRSKSRENAPEFMTADDMQPCHVPKRSISTVRSVGMLRRVRLRAICSGFRTEIFENFSRPQNFAFEIARERAQICVGR